MAKGTEPTPDMSERFREHEAFLWGICYRLTGSAADADDLVQETFLRAIERPPARQDEPWRPWLTRVALNLGKDALRRRKRRAYVGPFLPSPLETDEPTSYEIPGEGGTEGRYDLLESVSFAFLLALEALTPQQRAVLLLRDVFDYSVEDAASALGISAANVKTTHHRARRALEAYDKVRCPPSPEIVARSGEVLSRFLRSLTDNDVPTLLSLLTPGVVSLSDGGGEYFAARRPVYGRDRVARLFLGLMRRSPPPSRVEIRLIGGLPAIVIERDSGRERDAPRLVLQCEIDAQNRIGTIYVILASRKLTAVGPITVAPVSRA